MDEAILTDNDRKAELSFAYIAALAAHAGYTCQRGPQPDVATVDATIRSGDASGTQFDVQLKATAAPSRGADGLRFRLSKKNYIVLGGEGWTLRDFYAAGGLKKYLINSDNVDVIRLEAFVGRANQGKL